MYVKTKLANCLKREKKTESTTTSCMIRQSWEVWLVGWLVHDSTNWNNLAFVLSFFYLFTTICCMYVCLIVGMLDAHFGI